MALRAVDGSVLFTVQNVIPWVKQGTAFTVGGSFTTVPGVPSQEIQASTNTTMGYFNGQMLAYASGDGSGIYAGLTAGALVNYDPSSTDTGQKIWNTFIIADGDLTGPLDINTTYVDGSVQCATAHQNWVMRQATLYASGTPATDTAIVAAALVGLGIQSQAGTSADATSTETVFAY